MTENDEDFPASRGAFPELDEAYHPPECVDAAPPEAVGRVRRRRRGRGLPIVTALKPRCPRCHGARLRRYRSIADQGDGTSMSWVRCLNERCGQRFRLLME